MRPNLRPLIAALWVEPDFRGLGLGASLIDIALKRLKKTDIAFVQLAAKPHLGEYYLNHGWSLLEVEVGETTLEIFIRPVEASS